MTPLQIAAFGALACGVIYWIYRICRHSAEQALDGLRVTPSLDGDGPCHARLAVQMSAAAELAWLRFMAQIWREQVVIDRIVAAILPTARRKR